MPDADTVALYLFENNPDDVLGVYDASNPNSVGFSSGIVKEGGFSVGRFSATNHMIVTPTITEAMRTAECYFYWPTGHANTNRHLWFVDNSNRIRIESGGMELIIGGLATSSVALSDDTWTHIAWTTNDGGQARLFKDGLEVATRTTTSVPTNVVHYIGNTNTTLACDGYIDSFRFSDALRTSFPTPLISITDVIPSEGPAIGGSLMQIEGTDFSGTETITFGGIPATDVTLIDSTKLTCTAPAVDEGTHDVVVDFP